MQYNACVRAGYYVQIATLADVAEYAQEYLHVLSRPMVLAGHSGQRRPTIWTNVYADQVVRLLPSRLLSSPLNFSVLSAALCFVLCCAALPAATDDGERREQVHRMLEPPVHSLPHPLYSNLRSRISSTWLQSTRCRPESVACLRVA